MAYRVVILEEAQREYRGIVDYLANVLKSRQAAIGFMDEFARQVALIEENPTLFALSRLPELAAYGYRTCCVNNYIMLYKTAEDLVMIAHIFHQSQNYAKSV